MCRRLAGRSASVMTACTVARDTHMTEVCRQPGISGMAAITVSCRCNMRGMFTRSLHTVMTGTTATRDVVVIEVGRQPGIA